MRQLENAVARLVALSPGDEIGPQALQSIPARPEAPDAPQEGQALWERMEAFERQQIELALSASGGNQSEAARRLRVSRSAFVDRLKKYGLSSS